MPLKIMQVVDSCTKRMRALDADEVEGEIEDVSLWAEDTFTFTSKL